MITKEYLVNPSTWFDLDGAIFTHHERYYLSIKSNEHVFIELFNKEWSLKKLTISPSGEKHYEKKIISEQTALDLKAKQDTRANNSLSYNEFRVPIKANGADSRLLIYSAPLTHLMVLKLKFRNEDQMKDFRAPDFCLCDITDDPYFSQLSLSSKDYINIQKHINKHYKGKINRPDFFEQ